MKIKREEKDKLKIKQKQQQIEKKRKTVHQMKRNEKSAEELFNAT